MSRVLVLTQGFPRHSDDHHKPFILDHARALAATGAEVTVLCPSAPGLASRDSFDDVDIVRFRYAPRRWETLAYTGAMHRRARGPAIVLLPLFVAGFLVEAVRRARDADVIHAHWWLPSGLVGVIAGRLVGTPVVVHVHGTDAAIARGPVRVLARAVLRRAQVVLAAGPDLAAWAKAVAGVDAEVVPMPLGVGRVPPVSPPPADGPVLAIGRLVPEKGIDVLVRAAGIAGVDTVVIGDGDQRGELEALVSELGAPVRFVGSVAPGDLAAHYVAARLVAVPSRREGFGMVAAEAAAAGRAVIASRTGGLPAIVEDGINGALVPPGDEAALATALVTTDPALGAAGPAHVSWLLPAAIGEANRAAHARAMSDPPRAIGRPLLRISAGVLAAVAVVLCLITVRDRWSEAEQLAVDWSFGPVAAAVAAVLGANLLLSASWVLLVRRLGGDLAGGAGFRVWWTGQLGRYLPTGMGSVPARLALGARLGVARRPLVVATGAEVAVQIVALAALASLALPLALGGPLAIVLLVAGVGGLAAAAKCTRATSAAFVAAHLGQLLLRVAAFAALLELFDPVRRPALAVLVGGVGASYLLGLLAVFAPGGVGVREAALTTALSGSAGPTAALGAAVALRVVEALLEVVLVVGSQLLGRSRGGDMGRLPYFHS